MSTSSTTMGTTDVPVQIFEKFLQELTTVGVSDELVARLRKTLLEDKTLTDRALKEAVLGEEAAP